MVILSSTIIQSGSFRSSSSVNVMSKINPSSDIHCVNSPKELASIESWGCSAVVARSTTTLLGWLWTCKIIISAFYCTRGHKLRRDTLKGKKRIEVSLMTGGSGAALVGKRAFFLLLEDVIFIRTILLWRFSSAVDEGGD